MNSLGHRPLDARHAQSQIDHGDFGQGSWRGAGRRPRHVILRNVMVASCVGRLSRSTNMLSEVLLENHVIHLQLLAAHNSSRGWQRGRYARHGRCVRSCGELRYLSRKTFPRDRSPRPLRGPRSLGPRGPQRRNISFDDAQASLAKWTTEAAPCTTRDVLRQPANVEKKLDKPHGRSRRPQDRQSLDSTPVQRELSLDRRRRKGRWRITPFPRLRPSLLEANRRIRQVLGVTPVSYAYPCGLDFVGRGERRASYVPVITRHFLVGRGYPGEYANNPIFCDLSMVQGFRAGP